MEHGYQFDGEDLRIFSAVAGLGGISAAARHLGMPKATVSRRIAQLERAASGNLFDRTGRSLRLTGLGRSLLASADQVALAYSSAKSAMAAASEIPQGLIRIAAPVLFGQRILAPVVGELLHRFPGLTIDVRLDQRPRDPLRDGIDVAIWIAPPRNDLLVCRRLVTLSSGLFVTGAEDRPISSPSDLAALPRFCLASPADLRWLFRRGDEEIWMQEPPRCIVNDPDALLRSLLQAGRGVALLPTFLAEPLLSEGRLRRVLADWQTPDVEIHALMPPGRNELASVRSLIDAMIRRLKSARSWDAY